MNNLLYLYPLFFGLFLYRTSHKKQHPTFLTILILYLAASISAIYVSTSIGYQENINLSFIAIGYHCIAMLLLLYPFKSFDGFRQKQLFPATNEYLYILTFVVVLCTMTHIMLSAGEINMQLLLTDAKELRALLGEGAPSTQDRYTYTLNRMGGVLSGPAMALAFYYVVKKPSQRVLIAVLFLCSGASIISGMRVGAREYYVKYFFEFIMLFVLLSPQMHNKWKARLKNGGFVLTVLMISFFAIITIARFTDSDHYGSPFESLFAYLGQGMLFFSGTFIDFPEGIAGGGMCYPALVGHSFNRMGLNEVLISDRALNTFSTTIGSWVFDMGIVVTMLLCVVYFFVFRYIGKRSLNVYTLIYLVWAYEFVFSALFFYNSVLDVQRLFCYFLVIFLDVLDRGKIKNGFI